MCSANETVDLKILTVKEHLILLNKKMEDIKEDTEILKSNDRNKWEAIRKNENKINQINTQVKIYIALTSIIIGTGAGLLCKLLM